MNNLAANLSLLWPVFRDRITPLFWLGLALPVLPLLLSSSAQTVPRREPKTIASSPLVAAAKGAPASITGFRIVQEEAGQAVEILSTKPVVPSIQTITSPERVVIDLPNARMEAHSKRIKIQANQITALRADQFRATPPVARIVVDLLSPRSTTWEASGNRLLIHLGKISDAGDSPFIVPSVVSVASSPEPAVIALRASGPLEISSNEGIVGDSFTAGADTSILHLSSGGEVHVCPGTTVGVTPSRSQHNLLLSMGSGGLETHLALDDSADTVMTPDFRIVMSGPGEFHYAISADSRGDTCVRTLPGNTSPAVASELLGDRVYQIKPNDHLVFRSGQLDHVEQAGPTDCGCPARHEPVLLASNEVPASLRPTPSTPPQTSSAAPVEMERSPVAGVKPADNAPAHAQNNEVHVQIEAPLVFHASGPPPKKKSEDMSVQIYDPAPGQTATIPVAAQSASNNNSNSDAADASFEQAHRKGFFKRLGGFFSAIFH